MNQRGGEEGRKSEAIAAASFGEELQGAEWEVQESFPPGRAEGKNSAEVCGTFFERDKREGTPCAHRCGSQK